MDYIHFCSLIIFLYDLREVISVEYPEPNNATFSGCHGDFMNAACDTLNIILVSDVEGGSKPNSDSCPNVPVSTNNLECCQYDTTDCLFQAISSGGSFLNGCNGRTTCDSFLPITTLETNSDVCDTSDYKIFSQYILMSYYCVEEVRIGQMCEDFSYTGTNLPVYIQSENYPDNAIVGNTACDCSIETDNSNAAITVYTIHRTLYSVDGRCQQSLTIEEGNTNETFACDSNSDFVASSRTSSTSYVRLIWTNTASSNGGKFWVGFYAGTSSLTVNCPAVPQQSTTTVTSTKTPTPAFVSTTIETLATSASAHIATTVKDISETTSTAETDSRSPVYIQTETEDRYSDAFIATLCVIGFLLLIIIAGICFFFIRKREPIKDTEKSPGEANPHSQIKDTVESFQREQKTGQNKKEDIHRVSREIRKGRYSVKKSGLRSGKESGDRQSVKDVRNKILDTVLIKQENNTKDIKSTAQKTSGLRKRAMKRKAPVGGCEQSGKVGVLPKLKLKQGDFRKIQTVQRKMQSTKLVKQGSFSEEVKHLKQISIITKGKSSKSKVLRKVSLLKSFEGKVRTKRKRSTVKLETRLSSISDVGPNTAADPEIAEENSTIGNSEAKSNSVENDLEQKIPSIRSDTITDQNTHVSFITDKSGEGTVNGSSHETEEDRVRKRKRRAGRRLSTVKQTKKYESILKVVAGSSFKASSFYK